MAIMIHALLHYACWISSKISHQTALREAQPNTAQFFSDVGLIKLVLASELFVPRPYFMSFDSRKICEIPRGWLFNLFFKEGSQNWNWSGKFEIAHLLWILAKELVGKRFFDLSASYIDIKFRVKVISSLARVLQKVLGITFFFIWFEVRFFNFAMNKTNWDWLTLIINMAHLHQNKTINTLIVSALRSQQVQVELEDSINITYGILDNIFQIFDTENVSIMQIPCLAILMKKKKNESDIVNIVKKSTVNSLASIHFQLCFKYIIPCFTMLRHQILSLAMGSNFHIVHPCQP